MPLGILEFISFVADILTVGRAGQSVFLRNIIKRKRELKIIKGLTVERDFIFINYVKGSDDFVTLSRFQKFEVKHDLEEHKFLIADLFPHKDVARLIYKYCNIGEWQTRPGRKDYQVYCDRVRSGKSLYFRTKMMFQFTNHGDPWQGYDAIKFEVNHNTKELIVFIRMHDKRCFTEESTDSSVIRNSTEIKQGIKLYGTTIFSKDGIITNNIPNPPQEFIPHIADYTELVWIVNNLKVGDNCKLGWNYFTCT